MQQQGSEELAYLYKNGVVEQVNADDSDVEHVIVDVKLDKVSAIKFVRTYPNVKLAKADKEK